MTRSRVLLLGVIAFAIALIAVLPASWCAGFLPAAVQCKDWNGSIWSGSCSGLAWSVPGKAPLQADQLQWRLQPMALLRGRVQTDVDLVRGDLRAQGNVTLGTGGALQIRNLAATGRLDHALLSALPAGWTGNLDARQVNVALRGGKLQSLGGSLTATELTDAQGTRFGSYRIDFAPAQTAPFRGTLRDLGGPIELQAQAIVNADRSWQVDGSTVLRPGSPQGLARQLDQLGSADINGRRPFSIAGTD